MFCGTTCCLPILSLAASQNAPPRLPRVGLLSGIRSCVPTRVDDAVDRSVLRDATETSPDE